MYVSFFLFLLLIGCIFLFFLLLVSALIRPSIKKVVYFCFAIRSIGQYCLIAKCRINSFKNRSMLFIKMPSFSRARIRSDIQFLLWQLLMSVATGPSSWQWSSSAFWWYVSILIYIGYILVESQARRFSVFFADSNIKCLFTFDLICFTPTLFSGLSFHQLTKKLFDSLTFFGCLLYKMYSFYDPCAIRWSMAEQEILKPPLTTDCVLL